MSAHGQLDLSGNETIDPRLEAAANALWRRDAMRGPWPKEDNEDHYKRFWPRVRRYYLEEAEVALRAAGAL